MAAWRNHIGDGHGQRFHFRRRVHQRGLRPESIKVTDDSGKPIDNITLRVGESKNLKVTILPDAASQEFAASAARPDIAVVGDAKPTGITVSPESLTLRVGETASLNVNILPDYAPQEYTASIKDVSLASVRQQ